MLIWGLNNRSLCHLFGGQSLCLQLSAPPVQWGVEVEPDPSLFCALTSLLLPVLPNLPMVLGEYTEQVSWTLSQPEEKEGTLDREVLA